MEADYKKDVIDIMMESQEFRSLVFYIASIPQSERVTLQQPKILENSWKVLITGNNADYAVLNYYVRLGLLK
jgi:hypothetical protein